MPAGAEHRDNNSGNVGVVWCPPVTKTTSLPELDSDVSPSQDDGTARTGQADTQAHHSHQGPTACVQIRVPVRGLLAPVGSDCLDPTREEPSAETPGKMSFQRASSITDTVGPVAQSGRATDS